MRVLYSNQLNWDYYMNILKCTNSSHVKRIWLALKRMAHDIYTNEVHWNSQSKEIIIYAAITGIKNNASLELKFETNS